ncbi:hypothetical protein F2P81_022542 [Scophthalmus maximus]|uniref:GLTSCR protein conserved domain-containing protein n=1 Tax=Scophthalmus maximus TaxID=52904 RepID=A0A6A4S3A8_SCOMX|nr:hypothetical protein F2P81_022542 [Scophthalmus maximus]
MLIGINFEARRRFVLEHFRRFPSDRPDVDALNDYLHGSNSKSIGEDDVTNAAYGSDGSFFAGDTPGSNTGLKDGSSSMGEFGDDSAEAGLQLSSSLSFIEDELATGNSPGGVDLGGEDQPFDILQKSLMEADITEQTLAQEALLDSQPAPTLVQAPVPFPSQLVSGGYGGGVGVVTTATAGFPTGQFLQGVSQLPNGSAQHIQVLGSFGAGGGVMTLSGLERTPQLVLRPGAPVAAAGATTGGQVFAPTQGQVSAQKRPALQPLTREGMILQRLGNDHAGVQTPDRRHFTSVSDALQRLLPYHVFHGAPPGQDEFSQVDEEFEVVATQVLKRTQAMVNKYRRLLLVEAERSSPSSEMVMIDRTFNQEERSNLTQDKRMVLVDPDSFLEDFCCGMKSKLFQDPVPPQSSCSRNQSDRGSAEPSPHRTDSQSGFGDPGGGGGAVGPGAPDKLHPPHLEKKSVLELKRSQQRCGPSGDGSNNNNNSLAAADGCPQGNPSPFAAKSGGQTHYQGSHQVTPQPQYPPELSSPPHPDTDSALEAAVNSILEC